MTKGISHSRLSPPLVPLSPQTFPLPHLTHNYTPPPPPLLPFHLSSLPLKHTSLQTHTLAITHNISIIQSEDRPIVNPPFVWRAPGYCHEPSGPGFESSLLLSLRHSLHQGEQHSLACCLLHLAYSWDSDWGL